MPLFKKDSVDYYEAQIATDVQIKEAERLSRLNQVYPLSYHQINQFLSYDQDGEPEGWMLFSFEKALRPYRPKSHIAPDTVYTPYPAWGQPRYVKVGYNSHQYHAMLLLKGEDEVPFGSLGNPDPCPLVSAYALCRDPWSDAGIVAHWANLRLESLSGALGGALELQMTVSETDVELQKALRGIGYLASHYEKDLPYLPVREDEQSSHSSALLNGKIKYLRGRSIGEITFKKLLRLRRRQDLGSDFLLPRKKMK